MKSISYTIHYGDFEGPIELLLDLVKKKDLDIYDLKLSTITSDYLHRIKELEENDIELSSNFLVMGSLLCEIKTRSLFPDERNKKEEELLKQIVDYETYTKRKERLEILEIIESKMRRTEKDDPIVEEILPTFEQIKNVYWELIDRKDDRHENDFYDFEEEIAQDSVSSEEVYEKIKNKIRENENVGIYGLFDSNNREVFSTTLSVLLEMVKQEEVEFIFKDGTISICEVRMDEQEGD